MAIMRSKRERKARKTIARTARGVLGIMEAKEAMTSPHTYAAKKILERAARADRVAMRRGAERERYQAYIPKIKKWVKIDSRTGKIIGVKKDGLPYKGVRKRW